MFSQVFVCPRGGGGGGFPAGITGHITRGVLHLGGLPPGGGLFRPPLCLPTGGLPPEGGLGRPPHVSAYRRGLHLDGLGRPSPRDTWDTTGYGQQAGGTHSTGMLSCPLNVSKITTC